MKTLLTGLAFIGSTVAFGFFFGVGEDTYHRLFRRLRRSLV